MRYPGGKGKCYQQLINLMPPHDTYIESHIGGGAVLLNKKPAKRNIGIDKDPRVIRHWKSQSIPNTEFINDDALNFFSAHQFTGNELVYSDPPYLPETRRRDRVYRHDYSAGDHKKLLSTIQTAQCMVMISGYDNELYNDVLTSWRKVTFDAKTHTGIRTECVWLNFAPAKALHDSRHIGDTYRDRQTVKRRQERLQTRIRSMPSVERHALIEWLRESYGKGP